MSDTNAAGDDGAKREFPREPIHTEALIVQASGDGRTFAGHTRNLSVGGAFIESTDDVAVGAEVQLFIGSSKAAAALRTAGVVVHIAQGEGFGVRFLDVDDESRDYVASFISRFCQK